MSANGLRGEGLVDLNQIEVGRGHAELVCHFADGEDGRSEDLQRLDSGLRIGRDARQRRYPQRLCGGPASEDQCGGAIGDAGRIAGRHGTALFERRLERAQHVDAGVTAGILVRSRTSAAALCAAAAARPRSPP